jgi:hypothetical protein
VHVQEQGLLLGLGCKRPADDGLSRAQRKPRVELLVLATSAEPFADPGWVANLEQAWAAEMGGCRPPECEVVRLSLGGRPDETGAQQALERLGYLATTLSRGRSVSLDAGVPSLSANQDRGLPELRLTPFGMPLQLLGLTAGPAGELEPAEATLKRLAPQVFAKGMRGTLVLTDLCASELTEMVQRHSRAWPFVLMLWGRACRGSTTSRHVFASVVVGVESGPAGYSRARLSFDRNTSALLKADASFITFSP